MQKYNKYIQKYSKALKAHNSLQCDPFSCIKFLEL